MSDRKAADEFSNQDPIDMAMKFGTNSMPTCFTPTTIGVTPVTGDVHSLVKDGLVRGHSDIRLGGSNFSTGSHEMRGSSLLGVGGGGLNIPAARTSNQGSSGPCSGGAMLSGGPLNSYQSGGSGGDQASFIKQRKPSVFIQRMIEMDLQKGSSFLKAVPDDDAGGRAQAARQNSHSPERSKEENNSKEENTSGTSGSSATENSGKEGQSSKDRAGNSPPHV